MLGTGVDLAGKGWESQLQWGQAEGQDCPSPFNRERESSRVSHRKRAPLAPLPQCSLQMGQGQTPSQMGWWDLHFKGAGCEQTGQLPSPLHTSRQGGGTIDLGMGATGQECKGGETPSTLWGSLCPALAPRCSPTASHAPQGCSPLWAGGQQLGGTRANPDPTAQYPWGSQELCPTQGSSRAGGIGVLSLA